MKNNFIDEIESKAEKVSSFQHTLLTKVFSYKKFEAKIPLKIASFTPSLKKDFYSHLKSLKHKKSFNFSELITGQSLLKEVEEAKKCCDQQSFRLDHLNKIFLEEKIQIREVSDFRPTDLRYLNSYFDQMAEAMRSLQQKKKPIKAFTFNKKNTNSSPSYPRHNHSQVLPNTKGDLKIM